MSDTSTALLDAASLERAALKLEFVAMGESRVTADPAIGFNTVLGSCIAVCARHAPTGVGGVNHFLLPGDPEGRVGAADANARRYGAFAIEDLLNRVASQAGGVDRRALEIKAFGGARVMAGSSDVGRSNIVFLMEMLGRDGLGLASSDLGGERGRKLVYHPATGRAWSRAVGGVDDTVAAAEVARVREAPSGQTDVELFD